MSLETSIAFLVAALEKSKVCIGARNILRHTKVYICEIDSEQTGYVTMKS